MIPEGKKKTPHLKYILGPDPSPTASSFLQWSRQKALKQALWDNSCISFPLSTFMLQEIKVLERKGFITQLNFLFCPDHVFIWLDFASLFFSEINLPAYEIMLKILIWLLPYRFPCINDYYVAEIRILQWPSKIAVCHFLFPLYSKDLSGYSKYLDLLFGMHCTTGQEQVQIIKSNIFLVL